MARADLVISLVKAANAGDRALMKKTVEAMAAEERVKHHTVLAEQLEAEIRPNGTPLGNEPAAPRPSTQHDLVHEVQPQRKLADLVLSSKVRESVTALINEHHRSELLRSYNLAPRHRVLLIGPPGNGKTSLAEALATGLMVPLVVVRYDGLITSFLGETASRLRRLFDFAHSRRCVLFFDEFDTVGKERGDIHETGEIKRVVSSLLMQIDDLPSHVLVVCATNHPELLDRAVWRRFQLRLSLDGPTQAQTEEYFCLMQKRMRISLGISDKILAKRLRGASFSDLEQFAETVARQYVLALPNANIKKLTLDTLERWKDEHVTQNGKRLPR
jgi:SpoVK/Ycf46/Vps4 family AAA+-type ATPase